MKQQQATSYLFGANAPFVEELYARYLADAASVSDDWRIYFSQLQAMPGDTQAVREHQAARDAFAHLDTARRVVPAGPDGSKQVAVLQLINAYRFRGHAVADIDPINLRDKTAVPELDLAYYKLSVADLDTTYNTGSLHGPEQAPLREILALLNDTYCGHVTAEYMHITDTQEKRWIQQRLESVRGNSGCTVEEKRAILDRVIAAEEFEKYLHTRYVGQKRFSLEGAESLIPLLDALIQGAGNHKVEEIVLGMAHRGRLNVLTNILGKAPSQLFQEFEGRAEHVSHRGSGDVKYHMGFSSNIRTPGGVVHLALAFNPSHLEIVSPVVEGSVRARQHRRRDQTGSKVLPVLLHGDAAFSGQGVVMETFQMSQARGFTTGGTVHIVINNRIGFTTSHPLDVRSSAYCTEAGRLVQAPIFHVNGDDPEAVAFVTKVALDYRMVFRRDVVIDLVCYRRHGHSEADEPAATQPMMYTKIKQRERIAKLYSDQLISDGVLDAAQVDGMVAEYRGKLDRGELVASNIVSGDSDRSATIDWKPYLQADPLEDTDTTLAADAIVSASQGLDVYPDGFVLHAQVRRIMDDRLKMARGEMPVDWGFAEIMVYASLLQSGMPVRLSGQDSGRGTFFHRHAIVHNQKTGDSYTPLQHLAKDQQDFVVIDSLLSEEAVLGFEYGYSAAAPYALVIWEAQFGDFANGAQVVIDQFITSGESKWGRLSGLVMFLPHGFDGQGPEHSSARLERYLQLCAEDNIQVCMPSVPAQMFHLLRRQALRKLRKPLIVMTPKSLLRHKMSTSPLSDITEHGFRSVIGEVDDLAAAKVQRVIVCSGKVYFDVLDARRKREQNDAAIVRVEQLYPFPAEELQRELQRYGNAKTVIWCQEEPQNQGAWAYVQPLLATLAQHDQSVRYAGRPPSASPAVGYYRVHIEQLQNLVDSALAG